MKKRVWFSVEACLAEPLVHSLSVSFSLTLDDDQYLYLLFSFFFMFFHVFPFLCSLFMHAHSLSLSICFIFCHVLVANQVRTIRAHGCWWVAPPCSSWVWISRGSSSRTFFRPQGVPLNSVNCRSWWNCWKHETCFTIEQFYCWHDQWLNKKQGRKRYRAVVSNNKLVRRVVYLTLDGNYTIYIYRGSAVTST